MSDLHIKSGYHFCQLVSGHRTYMTMNSIGWKPGEKRWRLKKVISVHTPFVHA